MKRLLVIALLFSLVAAPKASAAVMTFALDDHRGGQNAGTHGYGLRLDGSGIYLSLSTANGASMFAELDDVAETFRIYGTAVQSLGNGNFGAAHSIEYTIGNQGRLPSTSVPGGEGSTWVAPGTAGASWVGEANDRLIVTNLVTTDIISLAPKQDSTGFAMDFYQDGFRLSGDTSTWVGRGWLDNMKTNDFLFTATDTTIDEAPETVPEPGSLAIFGIGALTMLGFNRRRKNKKSS